MKRRAIPFALSAMVMLVSLSPLYIDRVDPRTADLWTIPAASAVFAFMAVMFAWMRHRMTTDERGMTVFGLSLVDFFAAHIVLAVVWSLVYAVLFYFARQGEMTPVDIRTINRATILAGGALIVSTGVAMGYEMSRSGRLLSVHRDESDFVFDGTNDRRGDKPGRRTSDLAKGEQ